MPLKQLAIHYKNTLTILLYLWSKDLFRILKTYRNETSELTKNNFIYTPTHPHKSSMVVISHSSDSVCTYLRVAIHPHLNRVDSEVVVNTD